MFGGRFNPQGVPALYTSLTPMTAVREVNQANVLIQPVTLVSYRADISPVFDAVQTADMSGYGVSLDDLAAEDWWSRMEGGNASAGQIFAEQLISEGYAGLKTPSFVSGAGPEDVNIVLWKWDEGLIVNDQQSRLQKLAGRMSAG